MRAAVLVEPGRIELRDLLRPKPGPGEVVVRIRAALTCGTDLKTYRRGHPKIPTPTPFGHEGAGEIVSVGAGVEAWREGDDVAFAPTAPCGDCFWCRRDQEFLCATLFDDWVLGTYGEYVRIPERVVRRNLFRKPDGLSWERAALLEPVACVLHALDGFVPANGDTIVLLGGGGFSWIFLLALRRLGAGEIWVVARNPRRAETARALGASRVLEADAATVAPAVREATSGRGADLVVECTGQPAVWEAALGVARPGGEVILFGGCPEGHRVSIDPGRLHYEQVRIRSPFHLTPASVRRALELVSEEGAGLDVLFSGRARLEELVRAFDEMAEGAALKFVITP